MASSEGCSPYALSVGILIGIFIGREDSPEFDQEAVDAAAEAAADQTGGALNQQQQEQLEPLGPPPGPLEYRILSTVIADQLNAIARAEDKRLGELQEEIREAFSHSHFGRSVAYRLGRRLLLVRSPDDLVDLAASLDLLLMKPEGEETWAGHGRDRPMYLRPNSVFGVFVRRIKATCDGSSFSCLSSIYEGVVRYSDNNRIAAAAEVGPQHASDLGVDMMDDISMDLGSPPPYGRNSNGMEGFPGGSGMGNGGAGGHIGAFLQQQQGHPAGGAESEEKGGDQVGDGDWGEGGEELFSREVSAWQLQRRLQRKVLKLENGLSSQVPFEDVEREVQAALGSRSDVPKAHFLRLVNCMHHRELQGSLDSLHRYFDYAVRRGGPSMSNAEGFLDLARGLEGGSGRHTPQHAALALSRLHFEFGHLELASLALAEAIRVAQQNGDKACVAQAMGWLHQVLAAQGHPRAGDVLRRCASQAADLALHQLMASTTLLLAKEAAVAKHGNTGSSLTAAGGAGGGRRRAPPTRVWECLTAVASGDLNGLLESETAGGGAAGLLDSMAASGAGAVGRPAVEVRGGTGGEVAAGLSCQRLLVEAGAFERFGYSDMAAACARAVLQVHGDLATASNVELASAFVINAVVRGKQFPGLLLDPALVSPPPPTGGEEETKGGPETARREGGGGGTEEGCVFEAALSVALRQHNAFPHPVSNVWAAGAMMLLHEWMVNRGEFRAAEGLGMSLRGCCPLSQGAETFIEAHLQRVRLLRAQCRWAEAVKAASELAKLSDTRSLAPQYARLLLELSQARLGAEPASPIAALPHALRCLAVCESYSLDTIHASAMTHLAQVHLRMGSTRQARILLKACLGQLLANAPVQSQGEAWLVMAKCEIAEVSLEDPPPSTAQAGGHGGGGDAGGGGGQGQAAEAGGEARVRRGKALRIAVFHLDRAIAMLKRCHDFAGLRESFYLKSRVCGELVSQGGAACDVAATTAQRNAAAKMFLAVSKALVRALASPSPGLKIGPAEIRRYMSASMDSIPWG